MASDQSMNIKEYQGENDDTIIFSSKVHLLAGKLVPVVAIHSLGGSRANRLTRLTHNRVSHNQHKMRIHKPHVIQ